MTVIVFSYLLPFDSCLFFGIIKKREKTDLLELPDHHSKSSGSSNVTLKCPEAGFYAILSAPVNEIRANAKGDLDKLARPQLSTLLLAITFLFSQYKWPGQSARRDWSLDPPTVVRKSGYFFVAWSKYA